MSTCFTLFVSKCSMNRAAPDGGMRQETKLTPALAVPAPSGLSPTALDLCGQTQVQVREI